jgi:DUF1365 family protein
MSRALELARQREALVAMAGAQRRLLTVQATQAAQTLRPALHVVRIVRLALQAWRLWREWRAASPAA